ncbi:asparaginase [Myxococcus sp. K15C18031901]|uniref:asparaginase n=1 Tax=Myxococcus dinghuensis TaxID=2906761 RepID=UPI0020A7CDE8|nr:asparaginase [Myxococcus dinghuensis]MCP3104559.1 asparaginase [Myxococcus dinghuensis]
MDAFAVESTRSGFVESVHSVHVAVVDAEGRWVAASGAPERRTWWRSAAKPFQALAVVEEGAADPFGFGARELALMCGSHSSEPVHRSLAMSMLRACGVEESLLACGPHPPLSQAVADEAMRAGVVITPRWSNCSGKHAGMLALARHRGWSLTGYARQGHPVQERILEGVARWTGEPRESLWLGVDGCTAVCFGLPLAAMARAYARLGVAEEPSARRVREAMVAHPELVAGARRLCTELMAVTRGEVVAKVGAEGIYCAALPSLGLGVALKVADGDARCAPPALLEVLRRVGERQGLRLPWSDLGHHATPELRNTRGEVVGGLRVTGALDFR